MVSSIGLTTMGDVEFGLSEFPCYYIRSWYLPKEMHRMSFAGGACDNTYGYKFLPPLFRSLSLMAEQQTEFVNTNAAGVIWSRA